MARDMGPTADDKPEVPEGLTYCSDEQRGFGRKMTSAGFRYLDRDGKVIKDRKITARIDALAIPPAWTDVWICPRATGHIQATGRDVKGRKQYRYHADWSRHASESKFERLADFARALPRLRRRVDADLSRRGPCREKVLATTVRLLEISLIRVGNREYARQNRSYGLTTLHKRHVDIDGAGLTFAFRGKSGIDHRVSIRDRRLSGVLKTLRELPGQALFKYRDAAGDLVPVTSDEVNAYIREVMGDEFSAKDFRTWAGTVSAARALCVTPVSMTATERRKSTNACVKAVSRLLGNTPSVCRSSYIHPTVLALHDQGRLHDRLPGPDTLGFEKALIRLIGEEKPL